MQGRGGKGSTDWQVWRNLGRIWYVEYALDHILDKFLGMGLQGPLALLECV